MICPTCNGEKVVHGFACPGFKPYALPCRDCGGTGKRDDELLALRKLCDEIRAERARLDLSLREAAKRLDMLPSALSDVEMGRCGGQEAVLMFLLRMPKDG